MADFFTDIFDAVTGQKAVPQQTIIPTSDLLSQSYGALSAQAAPGLIAFNRALAPGLMDVQLGVERQYDPNIATLRGATTKSILDELSLGGTLGQELQEQVVRNALEGNAASGFGVGQGGRGLVARDLGLTSLDLAGRRRAEALHAVRTSPQLNELYNAASYTGLGANMAAGIGMDIRGVQAAQDDYANMKEDIRRKNFASLINTGGRIIGTVVGGMYGGTMGAQMGGNIGGSMITGSGVAGQGEQQQQGGGGMGGNQFTSLLSGWFGGGGIGGPKYGIGAGQQYAGPSGGVQTSVRASPVLI